MTLIQRFWREYFLSGYKNATEFDNQEADEVAVDVLNTRPVPYLFPQWLLTEANYKATMAYAIAYWHATLDCGVPMKDALQDSVPDEFREYIKVVINSFEQG